MSILIHDRDSSHILKLVRTHATCLCLSILLSVEVVDLLFEFVSVDIVE